MKIENSRRQFLRSTGSAGLLSGLTSVTPALDGSPAAGGRQVRKDLTRHGVEAEVRRRAEEYLRQRYLVVDYYRVRRRLAYPLPLVSLSIPPVAVPTISNYPWPTWMVWELEERVNSLGWAAEWFKREDFALSASRDLEALASWPKYCQYPQPDLSSGHAGRLLWTASAKWHWLSDQLRQKVRAACARHFEEVLPLSDKYYGQILSKQDFLAQPAAYEKLGNIPLIGTLSLALTSNLAGHPSAPGLNQRLRAILGAVLDLRATGHSEAVGYDGYILDFVADWLDVLSPEDRKEILDHPNLRYYLEESYMLAAPGAMEQVAELSDVEAREMPFHYSAQAKLARFQPNPVRAWYLKRWPLEWIRANALGALYPIVDRLRGTPPEAGALNAHYAVALRTGWEEEDLAVAISCTTSPMGHLQLDNGTLVVGTRGRWIVSDPGYQQYVQGSERDFTIGPAAHNYPVINGVAQDKKQPRLALLEKAASGVLHAKLELAGCYPGSASARSVVRNVWLNGPACVVVADQIQADQAKTLTYHWHGHPEAAWWCQGGWILLHMPDVDLWFTSPQVRLSHEQITRLPGSRGQLTLVTQVDPALPVVWWAFAIAEAPPRLESRLDGRAIQFLGKRFDVSLP